MITGGSNIPYDLSDDRSSARCHLSDAEVRFIRRAKALRENLKRRHQQRLARTDREGRLFEEGFETPDV